MTDKNYKILPGGQDVRGDEDPAAYEAHKWLERSPMPPTADNSILF